VRVFGRPQHQFVLFQNVNKAGIGLHYGGDNFHYTSQHFRQRIGGRDAASDFMQHVNFAVFHRNRVAVAVHHSKVQRRGENVQSKFFDCRIKSGDSSRGRTAGAVRSTG
jgi:hypothetical protein